MFKKARGKTNKSSGTFRFHEKEKEGPQVRADKAQNKRRPGESWRERKSAVIEVSGRRGSRRRGFTSLQRKRRAPMWKSPK